MNRRHRSPGKSERVGPRAAEAFAALAAISGVLLAFERGFAAEVAWESPRDLKTLSLEELFDMEVTSVSKESEPLAQAASAIQVITSGEIRGSGATSLPEALRLAANLEVAQVNSHDWAITSRGFNGAPLSNNSLANKLLVLIDGRSVYTPLFGGVFWDVQSVLLEDVDRIEVISGPGATLWGANAVNGVINVVTKSARETQGVFLTGAGGSFVEDEFGGRFGASRDSTLFARVYAQHRGTGNTEFANGVNARDDWRFTQGGFRVDYLGLESSSLTLQGDLYSGKEGDPTTAEIEGQNVLGRWTRTLARGAEVDAKVYADRTLRNLPSPGFREELTTLDAEAQHRFALGKRQSIVWGAGFRLQRDDVDNTAPLSFVPEDKTLRLYSAFLQDAVSFLDESLKVTLGTKFGGNEYTGVELQPSARFAWTPGEGHTLWGAASRAVRSPSRFDTEALTSTLTGDPEFESETVDAFEAGYRLRPTRRILCSLAGFLNRYEDVRSVNFNPGGPPPFVFANDQEAETRGLEAAATVEVAAWWIVRAGASYLREEFTATDDLVVPGSDQFEATDPRYKVQFHSTITLPRGLQFDAIGRYVDELSATVITPTVPGYFTCDARLAFTRGKVELSVVGRNLWEENHAEFGTQVPRSVLGRLACRF